VINDLLLLFPYLEHVIILTKSMLFSPKWTH